MRSRCKPRLPRRGRGTVTILTALAAVFGLALAQGRILAAEPMEFWDTVRWNASNDVSQAASFVGKAGRELGEVVNVGDVNGDSYADILLRVSSTNYALVLGGNSGMKNLVAAMDIDGAGRAQCQFKTSDTQGGPYLMRAGALGDIDDDGFADFCVIGSNNSGGGGNCYKWKYIVFGRRDWPAGLYDLNTPSGASPKEHIELHSVEGGQLDSNVSRGGDLAQRLGDLDGDGTDDMALVLPASSYLRHSAWHDNSFQLRFYRGNTNRAALAFYAYDQSNVVWGAYDKIWQGCTGGTYNRILMSDLDGDGRKELLLCSLGTFPAYVWKPGNFRTLGATPPEDTPKPPSAWPGGTAVTSGTHTGETNDLVSADCLIDVSGFGNKLLLTAGDIDGDGKDNLIFSSWLYSGWVSGDVVVSTNFSTASLTGTNLMTLSGQTNWLHRWTKVEGDGWYWGGFGLLYAGDLNGDGKGDVVVDDRLGDAGHGKGYTAGGVRFIAGSTIGWTNSTRLQLPLIAGGEHGDDGFTKAGDGLGGAMVDVSGFGQPGQRGFAVTAPHWDPSGVTNASFGKIYFVCPFASVERAARIRIW